MTNERGDNRDIQLSTGLGLLNDLLTRDPKKGITVPIGAGRSPIVVLNGSAGTGKSVLASIIARNLRLKAENRIPLTPRTEARPFPIYFSFGQHPSALVEYLVRIVGLSSGKYPLFLAPSAPRAVADKMAVAGLQRLLTHTLAPLRDPLAAAEGGSLQSLMVKWADLVAWRSALEASKDWIFGVEPKEATANESQDSLFFPIIFLDPINFFFDFRDSRSAIAELFSTFRELQWPLVTILEDGGRAAGTAHQQLASYVEFESDVLVKLALVQSGSYSRRTISVLKNRQAPPRFGAHMYRIENPSHGLSNVMRLENLRNPGSEGTEHPGFVLFRSIHWFLSVARNAEKVEHLECGVPGFSQVLNDLDSDTLVLVRGGKGGHKFAIAFNILKQGLRESSRSDSAGETGGAMLLLLGEDTDPEVARIATTGDPLTWKAPRKLDGDSQKVSVVLREAEETGSRQLVIVSFRPGHLSAEEFLWIVKSLAEHYLPSRILLENTGHLRMRFPELHRETMLVPALNSLTRAKGIMLIVTDVGGDGSDKELSYGLSASADYVVDVTLREATITNVRGKNYTRFRYSVDAIPTEDGLGNILTIGKPIRDSAASAPSAADRAE